METLERAVENYKGNNLVFLDVMQHPSKTGQPLGPIPGEGLVIDHLGMNIAHTLYSALGLYDERYQVFTGTGLRSGKVGVKEMIKEQSGNLKLTDGLVNRVIALSPNATFNVIKGGKLAAKIKAILCENRQCLTRDFSDRVVPAVFYVDGGVLKCKHCDTPYDREFEGREVYIRKLKGGVELNLSEQKLKERMMELAGEHTLTLDFYSFKVTKQEGKPRAEFTEQENAYLSKVEALVFEIHECILAYLVFRDYGRQRKISISDFGTTMNQVREMLGLDNLPGSRMMSPVVEYAISRMFDKTEHDLMLRQGVEEQRNEIVSSYKSRFNADQYVISNMLKILDGKADEIRHQPTTIKPA
jgi:aspartate carbamoyltransferase regulatory subunit